MPARRVILELGTGNDLHWRRTTPRPRCAPCRTPCTTASPHHAAHAWAQFQDRHVRRCHDRRAATRQGRPREGAHVPAARHRDGEGRQGRTSTCPIPKSKRYRGDRQRRGFRPGWSFHDAFSTNTRSRPTPRKVKIALREKGLDFKVETAGDTGLGQGRRRVRGGQPAQRGAGAGRRRRCASSTRPSSLEYLEDKFPSPPLLPRDPAERARARMIEELCGHVRTRRSTGA